MLHGGCFCGHVRYEAGGTPFHATSCHCSFCRKVAGAPVVAWFSVLTAELRFLAAPPRYFASSATARRGFCPLCGTSLSYQREDLPHEIDVTTASLDRPELVPPLDHTQTAARLPWVKLSDGLPRFAGTRAEGPEAGGPPSD